MQQTTLRKIDRYDEGFFGAVEELYSALPESRRSIFNDPQFLRTCWRTFDPERSPFALTLSADGVLLGAAFFRHDEHKVAGRRRKMVVPLVFKCSDFTPVLVGPSHESLFWNSVIRQLVSENLPSFLPRLLPADAMHVLSSDRRVIDYGEVPNPICIDEDSAFDSITRKKSLRRRTNWFHRNGELVTEHLYDISGDLIVKLARLHIEKWSAEGIKSKFLDPTITRLYHGLAEAYSGRANGSNRMVLTDIRFDGESIAMHIGFTWGKTFLYQIPATNVKFTNRWPGEVLIKSLFELARDSHIEIFDLGFGDEWYKTRFSNRSCVYRNVLVEKSVTAAATVSAVRRLAKSLGT